MIAFMLTAKTWETRHDAANARGLPPSLDIVGRGPAQPLSRGARGHVVVDVVVLQRLGDEFGKYLHRRPHELRARRHAHRMRGRELVAKGFTTTWPPS